MFTRVVRVLWFLVVVLYVATAFWAFARLPERAATHFGGDGSADGWMSPLANLGFSLGIGALLLGGMPVLMWALARGSGAGINMPNRDYWFAPERLPRTRAALIDEMLLLAVLVGLLLTASEVGIVVANSRRPPALDTREAVVGLVVFGVAVVAWLVHFFRRFRLPPTVSGSR